MTRFENEARQTLAMMAKIQKNELTVIGMKQGVLVRRADHIQDISQQTNVELERLRNEIIVTKKSIETYKDSINEHVQTIASLEKEQANLEAQRRTVKTDHGRSN